MPPEWHIIAAPAGATQSGSLVATRSLPFARALICCKLLGAAHSGASHLRSLTSKLHIYQFFGSKRKVRVLSHRSCKTRYAKTDRAVGQPSVQLDMSHSLVTNHASSSRLGLQQYAEPNTKVQVPSHRRDEPVAFYPTDRSVGD